MASRQQRRCWVHTDQSDSFFLVDIEATVDLFTLVWNLCPVSLKQTETVTHNTVNYSVSHLIWDCCPLPFFSLLFTSSPLDHLSLSLHLLVASHIFSYFSPIIFSTSSTPTVSSLSLSHMPSHLPLPPPFLQLSVLNVLKAWRVWSVSSKLCNNTQ